MLCFLQSRVGSNGFVRQHDLLSAVKHRLTGLECLLSFSQVGLLSAVQGILTSGEYLLTCLQCDLLFAVECVLGKIEILLRFLQGLLSLDALVCQGDLLCAVQLGLSSLEVLSGFGLVSRKCLLVSLQTKRIGALHIGHTNRVLVVDVRDCAVAKNGCVRRGNRNGLIQHGSDASTLRHGAVDQAPGSHALLCLGTRHLHKRIVLGHNPLELARHSFRRLVHRRSDGLELLGLVRSRRGCACSVAVDIKGINCCSHFCSTCNKSRL